MVGRISPQTPESGTHQHCSETLRTAHYSLPTLLAAPLFSYSYELLFLQALYFDNHLRCPGAWGTRVQSCLGLCGDCAFEPPLSLLASHLFSILCSLVFAICALLRASVLCFQWLAASFCKTPGWGVCPQTRRLKSTRSRLFFLLRACFPHSVLNSWLSCPEAGQP